MEPGSAFHSYTLVLPKCLPNAILFDACWRPGAAIAICISQFQDRVCCTSLRGWLAPYHTMRRCGAGGTLLVRARWPWLGTWASRLCTCLLMRPYSSQVDDASPGKEGWRQPNSRYKNGGIMQIGEVRPLVNETFGWSKALPRFRTLSSINFDVLLRAFSSHMQENVIPIEKEQAGKQCQPTRPENLVKVCSRMDSNSIFCGIRSGFRKTNENIATCGLAISNVASK